MGAIVIFGWRVELELEQWSGGVGVNLKMLETA